MKGYQAVTELLHRSRCDSVFSMLGAENVPWIAEGVRLGTLRLIKTRHEETAITAAGAYGRCVVGIGICAVTRGPGFANAISALAAAAKSHMPLLLIVGESPPTATRTVQVIDQEALSEIAGAGFHHAARSDQLETALWAAVDDVRRNGRPQVLSLGDGILDAACALGETHERVKILAPAPDDAVVAAVDALQRAEKPVIIAGQGAVLADCRAELEELASLTGARLATTLLANRFFSGNPNDLGIFGSWAAPLNRDAQADCDLVVAFGATLNSHTAGERGSLLPPDIIHCEADPEQPCLASRPEFALVGDARLTARSLIEEWAARGLAHKDVVGAAATWSANRRALLDASIRVDDTQGLDPRWVFDALDAMLPDDRVVVTDHGRCVGGVLPSVVDAGEARHWLSGTSFGSIGRGIGLAVGAAAACPQQRVVLFSGDGGFMMAAQDLDAVRINGLSLIVVILNDRQYGAEIAPLRAHGLPTDIIYQDLPDVPTLARAFGGHGVVLHDQTDIAELEIPPDGLVLIDARVDQALNVREAMA